MPKPSATDSARGQGSHAGPHPGQSGEARPGVGSVRWEPTGGRLAGPRVPARLPTGLTLTTVRACSGPTAAPACSAGTGQVDPGDAPPCRLGGRVRLSARGSDGAVWPGTALVSCRTRPAPRPVTRHATPGAGRLGRPDAGSRRRSGSSSRRLRTTTGPTAVCVVSGRAGRAARFARAVRRAPGAVRAQDRGWPRPAVAPPAPVGRGLARGRVRVGRMSRERMARRATAEPLRTARTCPARW
jgi:hypothetical protein